MQRSSVSDSHNKMADAQSDSESIDKRRAASRLRNYKGTARVQLASLAFRDRVSQIDSKNVDRLKRAFSLEGCLRLEPEHHIPAVVNDDTFQAVIDNAKVNPEQLKGAWATRLVELSFPDSSPLECLHGQHRVAAAEQYLCASDRWWVVDFFGTGGSYAGETRRILLTME